MGPIGIFDSGVGGLTVVRALLDVAPDVSLVYLGDTARVPYGSKSADTVIQYSLRNAAKLIDYGVSAIVVACNTASAVALPALESAYHVPIFGVIEPGVRAALECTEGHLGIIGTRGTIRSGAYQRAVTLQTPDVRISAVACPLFVPLAEEGWLDGDVAEAVAERYLRPLLDDGIDTLILGCTHYPLLTPVLKKVVGPRVRLINSGAAAVNSLESSGLLLRTARGGAQRYLVTDGAAQFTEVAQRFLGQDVQDVAHVDI